ncbi:YaaC-like Protein [Leptospira meyeri serovar Hardjo str. Went 5]|nr:YaaC-like Protein [Leptospira meyeri serovar Hardjo str. Went 5]
MLDRFQYSSNIISHFEKHSLIYDSSLADSISGSIAQSREYFTAAANSSLQISPLLLYYGTTNLYYATYILVNGKLPSINSHGMKLFKPEKLNYIGDIIVKILNSETGAINIYTKLFESQNMAGNWSLIDFLRSIPELYEIFLECYKEEQSNLIPITITKKRDDTFEAFLIEALARVQYSDQFPNNIINFQKAYLSPQQSMDKKRIILRPKLNSIDIGVYSYTGQKYLQIAYSRNNLLLQMPLPILFLSSLYALGFLTRYNPEIWSNFNRTDLTGEKLVFENFTDLCQRLIPNYALNKIHSTNHQFTNSRQGIRDFQHSLRESDVKELIKEYFEENRE